MRNHNANSKIYDFMAGVGFGTTTAITLTIIYACLKSLIKKN